MNYTLWLAIVASVLGLVLLYVLARGKQEMNSSGRPLWPFGLMLVLLAGCWVPYFLGRANGLTASIQASAPIVVTDWGLNQASGAARPDGAIATLVGTKFVPKYRDRYQALMIAHVEDDAVDAASDRVLDKSVPFLIENGNMQMEVKFGQPAIDRMNQPRWITLYLVILPKSVNLDAITTLNSIGANGGSILSMVRVGGPSGNDQEDQLP